jgi:hypothetical protein
MQTEVVKYKRIVVFGRLIALRQTKGNNGKIVTRETLKPEIKVILRVLNTSA